MAYFDYIRLAVDGGLFAALLVLAIRFLKATGPQINHLKLVELDASLKALVKEADAASRSLNDQLLKRQKGLEQLLFELQTNEGKLSRLITSCEEQKGILDLRLSRAQNFTKDISRSAPAAASQNTEEYAQEPHPPASRARSASHAPARRQELREQRIEVREEEAAPYVPAQEPSVEPPSFEITPAKATRHRASSDLQQKIERFVERQPPAPSRPASAAWQQGAEGAFSHIAESAERIQRSAAVTSSDLESPEEYADLAASDSDAEQDSYVDSFVETAAPRKDPRLGVLGGKKLGTVI